MAGRTAMCLRSVPSELEISDGLNLAGYVSVFHVPYQVNDFNGQYEETMLPGAFEATLRSRQPSSVKLEWCHGQDAGGVGMAPIGIWRRLVEDSHGLYGEARLFDCPQTALIREGLAAGAITGASFRFTVPKGGDMWNQAKTVRRIRQVHLYEAGPVSYPANLATSIGVRRRPASAQSTASSSKTERQRLGRRLRAAAVRRAA